MNTILNTIYLKQKNTQASIFLNLEYDMKINDNLNLLIEIQWIVYKNKEDKIWKLEHPEPMSMKIIYYDNKIEYGDERYEEFINFHKKMGFDLWELVEAEFPKITKQTDWTQVLAEHGISCNESDIDLPDFIKII